VTFLKLRIDFSVPATPTFLFARRGSSSCSQELPEAMMKSVMRQADVERWAADLGVSSLRLSDPKLRVGDVLNDSNKLWSKLKLFRLITENEISAESFNKLPFSHLVQALSEASQ